MGPGLEFLASEFLRDDRARRGFYRDGYDRLAARVLDVAADAGDCAAGAHAADQDVDLAIRVLPDFRARGGFVDRGIGRVLELLQQNVLFRIRGDDLVGLGNRAIHPFRTFGQHKFGTQRREQFTALDAHGLGHGERDGNAAGGSDEGERDAGVAACRFDQFLAGREHTALLGVVDHRNANAALDRIGRVAPLDLREHGCACAIGYAVQSHKRRFADGL